MHSLKPAQGRQGGVALRGDEIAGVKDETRFAGKRCHSGRKLLIL
jgi:hypothetical protein